MITKMPNMSRASQPFSPQPVPTPPTVTVPPVVPRGNNLGHYLHPAKIGPNTTAPAKARSVTAGPNGSFPIGDATHARLAIPMASRSEHAGNISATEAAAIKSKARAKLHDDSAPSPAYVAKMRSSL